MNTGRKSSLAGGVKRGGYWIAGPAPTDGEPTTPILIGEGMATVLSAHRATGWVALATLSSGTLPEVAGALRERYPDADLVVLADIGPGEAKARQAAEESQARLALPAFADDARLDGKPPTDFNDMAVLLGSARVGDRLREIAFRSVGLAVDGMEPDVAIGNSCEDGRTEGGNDEPCERNLGERRRGQFASPVIETQCPEAVRYAGGSRSGELSGGGERSGEGGGGRAVRIAAGG